MILYLSILRNTCLINWLFHFKGSVQFFGSFPYFLKLLFRNMLLSKVFLESMYTKIKSNKLLFRKTFPRPTRIEIRYWLENIKRFR